MKAVIQRVSKASVHINGNLYAAIAKGFVILVGIMEADTQRDVEILTHKISNLRIMADSNNKMNLSLTDSRGAILLVSQFTLCADIQKGNRPSFIKAMKPDKAEVLFNTLKEKLSSLDIPVSTGKFGAEMKVTIENEGPVTIIMDSSLF